jgi:hypothetical protein
VHPPQRRQWGSLVPHEGQNARRFAPSQPPGFKGRDKRPGLNRLMTAVAQREIDMVATWSVDRLGRSLQDLLGVLSESAIAGSVASNSMTKFLIIRRSR